jgi:adenylate cyclase
MSAEKFKRKLTAILSADVKGYSRLMGADEEATLRTLQEHKEVMGSSIQHHRGRVVGTAGDSVLAEFASVVDGVQCAVEIQQVLKAKNALLPEDRRMDFRIGINLGDVIEEGDTIYGDGVNIAARLEGLAEPGGICISESAYQQIENKLPLRYDYLGEHEVKNIAKPVRVYRARIEAEAAPSQVRGEKKLGKKLFSRVTLGIGVIGVGVVALILWQFVLRPVPPQREVASKEKMAFPLPDVPSIAVLPFVNMSEDPKQELLCDGMTEAIITALSKVPRLFVIARNSTFTYKGKPVKVKQVSEELGVRYVLEGSVQRSGDRIRITAQLIDALTGDHIWAERYDRSVKDIFAVQDEVTLKILKAMQVKLTEGEAQYLVYQFKGSQNLDCYLKAEEARKHNEAQTIEGKNVARRLAEEALALCPEHVHALVALADTYVGDFWFGTTKSPQESLEKAIALAQKAVALDDGYAWGHVSLCYCYFLKREYDKSIAEGERALALNPSGADARAVYADALTYVGRAEEAIPLLKKAIRLNPSAPTWYFQFLGHACRDAGRFDESVSAYKKALQLSLDNFTAHIGLATTYSMMGREKEARAEAAEVLRLNPKFSSDYWAKILAYKDHSKNDEIKNALRKAGLK